MKNSTIVFAGFGDVTIEGRPMPPMEPHQVLIRTHYTLISTGTELTVLSGAFQAGSIWEQYAKFPFVPGYGNVGEVVDTGSQVDRELIGQLVATRTAHARFTVANADRLIVVPQAVAPQQATFFSLAQVVMNGIRRSELEWGESAAVFGLGILGQLAVRFARLIGAKPVIGVDLAPRRLAHLPDQRGVCGVDPASNQLVEAIEDVTGGSMADVVFELTGNHDAIPSQFNVLREQGRLIILSTPSGSGVHFNFADLCNRPSFTIIGSHMLSHPPVATLQNPWTDLRHGEMFMSHLQDRELQLESLISHRVAARDAPELYGRMLADRSEFMGVVLSWED